jgi:hypothetical protein
MVSSVLDADITRNLSPYEFVYAVPGGHTHVEPQDTVLVFTAWGEEPTLMVAHGKDVPAGHGVGAAEGAGVGAGGAGVGAAVDEGKQTVT